MTDISVNTEDLATWIYGRKPMNALKLEVSANIVKNVADLVAEELAPEIQKSIDVTAYYSALTENETLLDLIEKLGDTPYDDMSEDWNDGYFKALSEVAVAVTIMAKARNAQYVEDHGDG